MQLNRVVITGMGAVSPYGETTGALWDGLKKNICTIQKLPDEYGDVCDVKVASVVPKINEKQIPREIRRAMSPMAIYACLSAWEALRQAGIPLDNIPKNMGVYASSTIGSTFALEDFFGEYLRSKAIDSIKSTVFFKVMSHTVATNIAMACGLSGTLYSASSACATGVTSLGMAYESIALGKEECVLAGAADEYHILTSATFDKLGAATHCSDPNLASRPFDKKRDGIVIGEGAGIVVMESLGSAQKRGATIVAEVSGYATQCSSRSIAYPDSQTMSECIQKTLLSANIQAEDIGYISAHATGTPAGDIAEATAIQEVFGSRPPVSSLKGYMGHTLAASGVLEAIASIYMLQEALLLPNYNLQDVDDACANINLLQSQTNVPIKHVLKNSFALGGVYASLVLSKYIP